MVLILAMRGWVREFKVNEDRHAPVENYPGFRAALDGLAYAGARLVQEPELHQA